MFDLDRDRIRQKCEQVVVVNDDGHRGVMLLVRMS